MHPLRQHIQKIVSLSDDQFEMILACSRKRKLRKNQLLLEEGEFCRSDFFVLNGSLVQYHSDSREKEYVLQFAFADWWIGDWHSLLYNQPSIYQIEALETSEILQFDYDKIEDVIIKVPTFERYLRKIFQKSIAAHQRRILWMQKPAKDRYQEFISIYGYFEQRLPQNHIASYLGITRESLSRLKKSLMKSQK